MADILQAITMMRRLPIITGGVTGKSVVNENGANASTLDVNGVATRIETGSSKSAPAKYCLCGLFHRSAKKAQ